MRLHLLGLLFDKEKEVQLIVDEEVDPNSTKWVFILLSIQQHSISLMLTFTFLEKAEHIVKRIRC